MKWIFVSYLALVTLIIGTICASLILTPGRDPNTLYSVYTSNVRFLDPARIGDTTSSGIAGGVFECLYNYDYYARPFKVIPELAVDMPEVSEDGKAVTIRVKRGVHYYDPRREVFPEGKGREVVAGDFVYAWKRIANFHLGSQNYSHMLEGKVVGIDDWWAYTKSVEEDQVDWARPIEGMVAVDDHTLRLKLTKPDPQLRYNLAHLPMAPMAKEVVDHYGKQIIFRPVGTGPYVISEYKPDQRVVFQANPVYRGHPEADATTVVPPDKRLPRVKRVQLDYFEEDLPAWAMFQQGLIDISGIPKDTFTTAISMATRDLTPAMRAKGINLIKDEDPTIWFYGFNMDDKVVGRNKPLRQAMNLAFDRQRYIDLMLNGRGRPANGPIPPGFRTYDETWVNPYTQFDLAAAREKMKEAERVHGGRIPPIQFLVAGTDTGARQIGEFTKVQMAQIGLEINDEYRTWARFQEMVDSRQAQFFTLGWQADYPDEQTFLQLFYSKNAAPGPNASNYRNPEYDALYEKASVMEPRPERDALYRQMQAIVREDCPWLFNCSRVLYVLHYDWVKNYNNSEYIHGRRAHIELDTELRRRMQSGDGVAVAAGAAASISVAPEPQR